jgi:hypothetical protein
MSNSDNLLARISESYRSAPGLEYIKETVPNAEEEYRIGFVKYLLTKEILPYSMNSKLLLRSMGALAASTLSTEGDSKLVQSKNMTPNKAIMNAIKAAKNANANNAALVSAWKPMNAWNPENAALAWNSAKPANAALASAWNSANTSKLEELKQSAKDKVASVMTSIPSAPKKAVPTMMTNIANIAKKAKTAKNAAKNAAMENIYGPGPNANNTTRYPTMYETVPNAPTASAPAATTSNASRAENVTAAQKNMGLKLRRASKLGGRRTKKRSRKSKASKKN